MNVGIGLPSAIPGAGASTIVEWARRADGVFSSLGVVDRLRYESLEPMSTLAAAAAASAHIGLVTMVVIGPLRNTALLAKQAATVDSVSGGRFTLGVAMGARDDDYLAAGFSPRGRGDLLAEQLVELRTYWERHEVGPMTESGFGPPVLVGGASDVSFLRAARYADGYVHGGGPPRTFARAADRARTAWSDLGRPGGPALWAQGYFALGDDDLVERGRAYVADYYSFTGPFASRIAEGMLGTPQAIAQFVRGYAEAGCDELVLLPAVAELEQMDRLRDALAGV
jgi:alkanesulfonate monooxygenase SsuD/methylene tetrahydromethanopterin reductase-like flavin-dependent oxidoreductase (luciferase family)